METSLIQHYGPITGLASEIRDYLAISETAFIKCSELAGKDPGTFATPAGSILSILMYHALNTSYSTRLLTTYAQPLEGLALLRTRLEQVIVCSYLLHVEPVQGIQKFLADIGKVDYRVIKTIEKQSPQLMDLLRMILGNSIDDAAQQAKIAAERTDANFDLNSDKLQRKWTSLSAYDLAVHRDRQVGDDHPMKSLRLEWFYLGVYKLASIFVHSDTGVATNNFLSLADSPQGRGLSPPLPYVFSNLFQLAQLDVLQCYEVLHFLKRPGQDELVRLHQQLTQYLRRDFGI